MRAAVAGAVALLLGGCGLGPGPQRSAVVRFTVTRDFGARTLAAFSGGTLRPSDTVMRLLESHRRVQTTYGGDFVQAIDGLSGSRDAQRDWFYYVNGSEAAVGAADYTLSANDVIQWDYHSWHATLHVPAIVGAFPEPFRDGLHGQRLATRIECDAAVTAACATARTRLRAAGVSVSAAPLGSAPAPAVTIVVATWPQARAVTLLRTLERGPAASGVYARFEGSGRLSLLDPSGAAAPATAGTGLVAATAAGDSQIVWTVTGVDAAGVARAAAALSPSRLRDAFALAVTPAGDRRLPLEATR